MCPVARAHQCHTRTPCPPPSRERAGVRGSFSQPTRTIQRGPAWTATGVPFDAERSAEAEGARFVPASFKDSTVVNLVARPVLEAPGTGWLLAFLAASLGTLTFGGTIIWLLTSGVGVWGINSSVVWGSPVANYVWWIGIGNAGTLISALLLVTRSDGAPRSTGLRRP